MPIISAFNTMSIPYVVQENAGVYRCVGTQNGIRYESDGTLDVYGNASMI